MNFSVVIPLYNKKESIIRALNSIANQTVLPNEVIVVDDGSTDGSADVVKAFLTQDFDVFLIEQKNNGVSSARNNGIFNSKNDLVFLLDADDYWAPDHCEFLSEAAIANPNVGFFFAGHYKGIEGKRTESFSLEKVKKYPRPLLLKAYRRNRNLIHTSAVGFRKSILESDLKFKVGERRSQDILLWLLLAIKYDSFYSPFKTSVKTNDYAASSNRAKELPAHIKFFSKNKEVIPSNCKVDILYILIRSSLLEYISSSKYGVNLAPDLAKALKPISKVFFIAFKILSFFRFHRLLQKILK